MYSALGKYWSASLVQLSWFAPTSRTCRGGSQTLEGGKKDGGAIVLVLGSFQPREAKTQSLSKDCTSARVKRPIYSRTAVEERKWATLRVSGEGVTRGVVVGREKEVLGKDSDRKVAGGVCDWGGFLDLGAKCRNNGIA